MVKGLRLILLWLCWMPAAWAIDSFYLPEDPEQLARYQSLSEEFRCLVCQNQNLADSNADLAKDLKQELVQLLESGRSDDEIREFLVARYGDFVLYRPPVNEATAILWLAPMLGVLGIGLAIVLFWRRTSVTNGTSEAPDGGSQDMALDNALQQLRAENKNQEEKN